MISDTIKAKAITQIRRQVPLDEIANELCLPLMLIKDWQSNLDVKDLVIVEANVAAIEDVLKGEVVEPDKISILKDKLEDAAIEVTKEVSIALGDPMYAKSLQLCADTIAKLYVSIVKKDTPAENPNNIFSPTGLTAFQTAMRD